MWRRASENGKEPLLVNLDETRVLRSSPDAKGIVVGKQWWPNGVRPLQSISSKVAKAAVTHVGRVTHRADIQPLLPQVFIGNFYLFTLQLLSVIEPELPSNMHFWRCKSGWNSSELMVRILRLLADALSGRPELQIILAFDAASIHPTKAVLRAAKDLNIWLLVVPPRTTYALQPLDTHIFAPYKAFLRRAYRDAKDAHGRVSLVAWARTLIRVVREILEARRWQHAFEQTGLLGDRRVIRLCKEIRGLASRLVGPTGRMPPVHVLRAQWLANRFLNYSLLLSGPLGQRVRFVLT